MWGGGGVCTALLFYSLSMQLLKGLAQAKIIKQIGYFISDS